MNMHSGGPGQPPPGPHHFPPPHHGHPHYPPDPTQGGYPPPVHIHHVPHGGGEEHLEDMHDPDDSDGGPPGGEGVGVEQPPKRKRRRQALSCTECKRRKIKCDRANPCGPCVRRGDQDKCKWHVVEPIEKFVTRAEYDDLRRKFDALEMAVVQLTGRPLTAVYPQMTAGWAMAPVMGEQDHGGPLPPRDASVIVDPNLQPADAAQGGPSSSSNNVASESKKRGAQTLNVGGKLGERLRHPVFSPLALQIPTQPQFMGPMTLAVPATTQIPSMAHSPTMPISMLPPTRTLPILPILHPDNWSQFGATATPPLMFGLTSLRPSSNPPAPLTLPGGYWIQGLPTRLICDAIVDYYFKFVSWAHSIVFRPLMEKKINAFWTLHADGASSAWVALYFMILYHGVSNMDPQDETNASILPTHTEWRSLCQTFWHGAQFALSLTELAAAKDIESVQALTLLAFVYASFDSAAWQGFAPTMAFTIRLAYNMGFANVPDDTITAELDGAAVEREIKRRIWWTLVTFDWQHAALLHSTYIILREQFTTKKPGNLNLEDLQDGGRYQERSITEPTSASLLLACCQVAETTQQKLASNANFEDGGLKLQVISDYDKAVAETLEKLPPFLIAKNEAVEKKYPFALWQRVFFTIGVHSSIIALHKHILISDYENPDFSLAVRNCLTSADKILLALKDFEKSRFPGRRWWGTLLHCFKACIILLIDLQNQREEDPSAKLSEARLSRIHGVVNLLLQTTEISAQARKATLILQHLLSEAASEYPGGQSSSAATQFNSLKRNRETAGIDDSTDVPSESDAIKKSPPVQNRPPKTPRDYWKNIFDLDVEVEIQPEST